MSAWAIRDIADKRFLGTVDCSRRALYYELDDNCINPYEVEFSRSHIFVREMVWEKFICPHYPDFEITHSCTEDSYV